MCSEFKTRARAPSKTPSERRVSMCSDPSLSDGSKHMPARRLLGVFEGARARVLKSEHMLGSLVLGLDARRVLGEHQRITEWYKMWEKHRKNR